MTGEPTSVDGDLTVTTMGWHGTALLRFQTGTWVDPLVTDPCPGCGRTVPRLVGEIGASAWQLPMAGDDGRLHDVDLRGVGAVLTRTGGIRAWRAELRGPRGSVPRDRLIVEVAGDIARAERADLERRLEAACGIACDLSVGLSQTEVRRAVDELGGLFVDLR
jgi:hypothetical protein